MRREGLVCELPREFLLSFDQRHAGRLLTFIQSTESAVRECIHSSTSILSLSIPPSISFCITSVRL